jgi:hypothetical protein
MASSIFWNQLVASSIILFVSSGLHLMQTVAKFFGLKRFDGGHK